MDVIFWSKQINNITRKKTTDNLKPACVPTDCLLGPATDEEENKDNLQTVASSHHPPVHPFPHNAFHVWDQDEVMVPLPQEESPVASPLLLAAIPYIPAFFPVAQTPTSNNSPLHSSSPKGLQGQGLLQGDLIWLFWKDGQKKKKKWYDLPSNICFSPNQRAAFTLNSVLFVYSSFNFLFYLCFCFFFTFYLGLNSKTQLVSPNLEVGWRAIWLGHYVQFLLVCVFIYLPEI